MKKYLTLQEIQNEEKEMLREIIKFLDEHEINYYISYGTMLGAIRHNGFIPWDDDIDISMLREDFEKIVKIAKEDCKINENLEIQYYELGNSVYPFIKIINKKVFLDEGLKFDNNLWIDIFSLDNLPNDNKKIVKFMNKTFAMAEIYMVKNFKYKEIAKTTRSKKATIIKYMVKPFTIFINKKIWMKFHLKLSKKYNKYHTKYISSTSWHGKKVIYFPKSILETATYDFEGLTVKGFKNYDEYLKLCYGDNYMKLPPESERQTHNIKAYIEE